MQNEPLVGRVGRKVGLAQESIEHGKAGLQVAAGRVAFCPRLQVASEADQTLGSNCSGRTIDRLIRIERVGRPLEIIAQFRQTRGACIPVRNTTTGSLLNVKIASCLCSLEKIGLDFLGSSPFCKLILGAGC